ncbi:peptide chain release factor N(5)-glutamine methyltransferase [Reyranella sp.]|uniref:peptide chain release factor N(5)-glutamine methyltransferase n=1 Tax=Reyranella sp. TaxID=1929291 RepID=UPI002728AE93|nr:peptide chain release factor N(5)-glutamine methyltransferase [Reyranella sp.]MDO8973796.1 peptide chain release factor N(5)-glutamine methyltransferase [Reyranella sp.]
MAEGASYDALLRDTAVALTAAGIDNVRFEARLLLSHATGLTIEQLISRGPDAAPAAAAATLRELTARRVRREPMAYILGEREFWGLPFKVSPAVLIPRPDSETVIETVLDLLPDRSRKMRILDLGLGSGCLLLTLLREYPQATGVGIDASEAALAVARGNAEALGVAPRARLSSGDWRQAGWSDRLEGPFDLLVSNPPYIESAVVDGLMPEVAAHEPRLALDGGADGFAAYRIIAAEAPRLVVPGGWAVVEAGEGQAPDIAALFGAAGLTPKPARQDLGGIARVVPAQH